MKTTGFASPATEYEEERLDFNRALQPFPASEYEFRYSGHEMESFHIQDSPVPTDSFVIYIHFLTFKEKI